MARRRRKLLHGERLRPGCTGYAFSREDCAKGGTKTGESKRAAAERHKQVMRAHHQRQNRAHNLEAWKRGRDANGRFIPSQRKSPTSKATEATEPASTSPRNGTYGLPPAYGFAERGSCGWVGPEYSLVKHTRMKHASPTSPWHPMNAALRSAKVRSASARERKRLEEEARAFLSQALPTPDGGGLSESETAPTERVSSGSKPRSRPARTRDTSPAVCDDSASGKRPSSTGSGEVNGSPAREGPREDPPPVLTWDPSDPCGLLRDPSGKLPRQPQPGV